MNKFVLMNLEAMQHEPRRTMSRIKKNSPCERIICYLAKHGTTTTNDLRKALELPNDPSLYINYLVSPPYNLITRTTTKHNISTYTLAADKTLANFGIYKDD